MVLVRGAGVSFFPLWKDVNGVSTWRPRGLSKSVISRVIVRVINSI